MKRFILTLLFAALAAAPAWATVADMRTAVLAEDGLYHYYAFEGDETTRVVDDLGDLDLVETAYGSGDVAEIVYDAGFDATTQAFTPQRAGSGIEGGAALLGDQIDITDTLVVEALLQPGTVAGGGNAFALVAGKWPNRGYFLLESDTNELRVWVGDGQQPFQQAAADEWYYVAAVFENDGANTTINTYVANLTAGDETLTHQTLTQTGIFGAGMQYLGVGAFATGTGGLQEAFGGTLDEVALYNQAVDQATFQAHLDALYEPGDSTLEGDLDGDGFVGSSDLDIVRGAWGESVTGAAAGDPSGDGIVGSADLDIIRANWGRTGSATAIPEPGVAILSLCLAVLAFGLRRR